VTKSPANSNSIASDDALLRSDVRKLGDLLGQSLVRQEGQGLLDLVESVRKAVREGGGIELLEKLSVEDSVQLVRAFSTYFHLANVAEQVHRARVLAESRAAGGSWLSRAIDKIEEAYKAQTPGHEFTHKQLEDWISELMVRPVFTAHPTEAARRSILNKLGEVAKLLDQDLNPRQNERLAETVDLLWQTDELRLDRPEPLDEAMNALYYLDDLARNTVPEVLNDFARELRRLDIELPVQARPLTFGTWIGGDRDGNPNITAQVTEDFELNKSDQIDLLNRSMDYFKSNDIFNKADFEEEVFRDPAVIESFQRFDQNYRQTNEIEVPDEFDISLPAVKKQAKVFKSILKLDRNFHIYIHGNKEMIEHGVEKDGRKFYKIYYENES
jgi:phosphoenolpyruvate carboxylase